MNRAIVAVTLVANGVLLARGDLGLFKSLTDRASLELEGNFVKLGESIQALAKTVSIVANSQPASSYCDSPAALGKLTVVGNQVGCRPYATDARPSRRSEIVISEPMLFTEPQSSAASWAAPGGVCLCGNESSLWNAYTGATISPPNYTSCLRYSWASRFSVVSSALDTVIPPLQESQPWISVSVTSFTGMQMIQTHLLTVKAWYFGDTKYASRVWIPPDWSFAPMNKTFHEVIGCIPNNADWVSYAPFGTTKWTHPYIDAITRVPILTVAAPSFTASGERLGAMFADVTLSTLHTMFSRVQAPSTGALMMIVSSGGLIVAMPSETLVALYGTSSAEGGHNFNVTTQFPSLWAIASGRTSRSGYEIIVIKGVKYVAIGSPFRSFNATFIAIAPRTEILKESLLLGFAMGIPLLLIALFAIGLFTLAIVAAKLKKRVKSLQAELVTIKASDILGTPADEAIKTLLRIKDKKHIKDRDKADIAKIVSLIACNKLYKADYSTRKRHGGATVIVDSEIDAYLVDQIVNVEEDTGRANVPYTSVPGTLKITPRTRDLVHGIGSWDFDVMSLPSAKVLGVVVTTALETRNLIAAFEINAQTLESFLQEVTKGYFDNPYHSRFHASDVVQAMLFFLQATPPEVVSFTEIEVLAAIFACAIHDYRHPGVNNNFLVATRDPLSLRYNGVSVLESMHVSEGIQLLLSSPQLNFLSSLSNEAFAEFYSIVVQLVLATDMSKHIEITSQFSALVNSNELNASSKQHRLLVLKILIKLADISNPLRPWKMCHFWATAVMNEFFNQGDQEKKLGLAVSPFMDRVTTSIVKCQSTFGEFVCLPVAESVTRLIPSLSADLVGNAKANMQHWKAMSGHEIFTVTDNTTATSSDMVADV